MLFFFQRLVFIILLFLNNLSFATEKGKFFSSLGIGLHNFSDLRLDDYRSNTYYSAGIGYYLTKDIDLELNYERSYDDYKYGIKNNNEIYSINLRNSFIKYKINSFYLGIGFSDLNTDFSYKNRLVDIPDDHNNFLSLAAGIKTDIYKNFSLRSELKLLNSFEETHMDYILSFNLVYSFGKNWDIKTAKKENSCEKVKSIYFLFNSTELNEQSISELNKEECIRKTKFLLIEGNADNIGSLEYNNKIAYDRATSVKEYIHENFNNIDNNNIEVISNGENKPMYDNKTEKSRAGNRRVDLFIR